MTDNLQELREESSEVKHLQENLEGSFAYTSMPANMRFCLILHNDYVDQLSLSFW